MRNRFGAVLLLMFSSGCLPAGRTRGGMAAAAALASSHVADQPFVRLPVAGHEPAVVSVPPRGLGRRPLLVAAHGAWDRPEPHCELWRRVVGERAFILCPRGKRTDRRVPHDRAAYFYPDHFALAREVLAAIAALSARYPDELDANRAVWAGFSQGAIHGALVVTLYPQLFPRAALIEVGNPFFNEWSPFAARKYARGGAQRVLFGCGSPYCVRSASRCAGFLERSGVSAKVVHAAGAGHSYGPAMEAELHKSFMWLVADDPRWQ
jgi:predicted esterase